MDQRGPSSPLDYQSSLGRRLSWPGVGQFAAGFLTYCLVAACTAVVGGLGSLPGMVAAVAGSLAFVAFVVRRHKRQKAVAITVGVMAGLTLTVVALGAFFVWYGRAMRGFGF